MGVYLQFDPVVSTKYADEKEKNLADAAKRWESTQEYNGAIKLCPRDHVLYSNRSACYMELKQFPAALGDGQKCIKLNPNWAKGYYRTGLALFKMGRVEEAAKVYEQGMFVD